MTNRSVTPLSGGRWLLCGVGGFYSTASTWQSVKPAMKCTSACFKVLFTIKYISWPSVECFSIPWRSKCCFSAFSNTTRMKFYKKIGTLSICWHENVEKGQNQIPWISALALAFGNFNQKMLAVVSWFDLTFILSAYCSSLLSTIQPCEFTPLISQSPLTFNSFPHYSPSVFFCFPVPSQ